jgi:hypothetical protein
VDGLVSTLAEDELNGLILEFQDDPEFWSTLGIEPPPPPPGFGPGPIPPGGEFGPEGPFPPPVFVPPPEQLEFIRGGDKDTKKAVIFELAGQDGGVDGLVSTLAEDELNGLILEFQDDPEFWSTLGIEPPPPPPGFGPGPIPPGGEFGPEGPFPPPVFVPPPEQLEFIRGGDKDTKKAVIFELAGQDGGVDGLVSTLAEDELNGLILEFQDDPEFWSTLGIEPPPPPPGFGPGPIPPGGEFGPEGPFPPPVFVPPPEQLEFIRGGDKDTKKAVIFELAGQDGGVDGLVSIFG